MVGTSTTKSSEISIWRKGDARMESLTQCWFTRVHRPHRDRTRHADGSITCTCRYCQRALVSWDREHWNLADGLDVTRLAELTNGRLLTLIDTVSDMIVRRFPVRHFGSEAEIDAFKQELRRQYALDDPDTRLALFDSAPPRARRKAKSDTLPTPGLAASASGSVPSGIAQA